MRVNGDFVVVTVWAAQVAARREQHRRYMIRVI